MSFFSFFYGRGRAWFTSGVVLAVKDALWLSSALCEATNQRKRRSARGQRGREKLDIGWGVGWRTVRAVSFVLTDGQSPSR